MLADDRKKMEVGGCDAAFLDNMPASLRVLSLGGDTVTITMNQATALELARRLDAGNSAIGMVGQIVEFELPVQSLQLPPVWWTVAMISILAATLLAVAFL